MEIEFNIGTYVGHVENGVPNGEGVMDYKNGIYYEGGFINGQPNGNGKFIYSDKSEYEGKVVDGQPNGYGKLIIPGVIEYEGEFIDDKYHGEGTLTHADGDKYEGQFIENRFIGGEVELFYSNGGKYIGGYLNGEPHGQGTHTFANGDKYEGEFINGKQHGHGTLTYANGDKYEGGFINGKPHGQGELNIINEYAYIGEFKEGKEHGEGICVYVDRRKYKGEFNEGKRHGQGKLTYANGNKYEGEFKEGERHGQGTLKVKGDYTYEGKFKEGVKEGKGKTTFKDGRVHEGEYKNNEFGGHGKLTYIEDNTKYEYEGEFKEDLYNGHGKYSINGDVIYEGEFKGGTAHDPDLTKKDQKVLILNKERSILNLRSIEERYKTVKLFDETSTIDAIFLKSIITKPTKGEHRDNKLKIVISEHGGINGEIGNENFFVDNLNAISNEIKGYNKNAKEPIKNVDIVLNCCYGSKIVSENKNFQEALKSIIRANANVRISTGDENFSGSNIINNHKNLLPIAKTNGKYVINEYLFTKENDFDDIESAKVKVKEYENSKDFMKDKYEGKVKKNNADIPLSDLSKFQIPKNNNKKVARKHVSNKSKNNRKLRMGS